MSDKTDRKQQALERALSLAAGAGETEIVRSLIEAGVDIHANDDDALFWASRNGHALTVEFLLKAGADTHGPKMLRQAAAWSGDYKTIRLLLEREEKRLFLDNPSEFKP